MSCVAQVEVGAYANFQPAAAEVLLKATFHTLKAISNIRFAVKIIIYICSIFAKAARSRKDFFIFCGEEANN